MKQYLSKLKTIMLGFVAILLLSTIPSLYVKAETLADVKVESSPIAKVGETITYKVNGLSFESDKPTQDVRLSFFGESYDTSTILESVHLPYIEAVVGGQTYGVRAFLFTVEGEHTGPRAEFDIPLNQKEGVTIERFNFYPDGETRPSKRFYIIFRAIDSTGQIVNWPGAITSFHQEGTVDFSYLVNGDGASFKNNPYPLFQGEFTYYDEATSNQIYVKNFYGYSYYSNSTIQVAATPNTNLHPGDEVELTFTISNPGPYTNTRIFANLEVAGLELIDVEDEDKANLWKASDDGYQAMILTTDGKWKSLAIGETVTLTRKFKIKDDFKEYQIPLTPYLYTNYERSSIKNGDEQILYLAVPSHVTYNPNGAQGEAPVDPKEYEKGNNAIVLGKNSLSKEGYEFTGWNTQPDGSGEAYAENSSLIMNDDITLYAQWKEIMYHITYSGNENTSGDVPVDEREYHKQDLVEILGKNTLEKEGYTFEGWNTSPDGTGTSYKEKDSYQITEDTILYAQWKKVVTEDKSEGLTEVIDLGNNPKGPSGKESLRTPKVREKLKMNGSSVKTGDHQNILFLGVLLFTSVSIGGYLFIHRNKRKENIE